MRQSSARHASLFPEEVVSAFHRRIAELRGFGLIALVAVCLIALGTWSATDPNFSYATDGTVKNLMGRAGAAFSDFMMQVLGLGSLALLIPLGVWGWLVMTHRAPSRWRVRLLFWLGGVLLACGFAACFRAPTDWPLPTGLGGAIGDSLVFVPSLLLGSTANASRILMGLLFGMPMIFTLAIALGAGFRGEVPREEDAESFDPETGEIRDGSWFLLSCLRRLRQRISFLLHGAYAPCRPPPAQGEAFAPRASRRVLHKRARIAARKSRSPRAYARAWQGRERRIRRRPRRGIRGKRNTRRTKKSRSRARSLLRNRARSPVAEAAPINFRLLTFSPRLPALRSPRFP
jgi:hypothetical protein